MRNSFCKMAHQVAALEVDVVDESGVVDAGHGALLGEIAGDEHVLDGDP